MKETHERENLRSVTKQSAGGLQTDLHRAALREQCLLEGKRRLGCPGREAFPVVTASFHKQAMEFKNSELLWYVLNVFAAQWLI